MCVAPAHARMVMCALCFGGWNRGASGDLYCFLARQREPLAEASVANIIGEIIAGLAALHALNICPGLSRAPRVGFVAQRHRRG